MEVEVEFSEQANLLVNSMENIDKKDVLEWFVKVRKIKIGGGDIVSYLDYLKDLDVEK